MNKAFLLLFSIALAGCQAENHADGHADAHGNHTMPHSDTMDMSKTARNESPATLKVSFASEGSLTPNKAQAVTLMLADAKTGAPIGPNELEIAHTKKLHLLIIDESLTDYQHIHPVPGAKPGEWTFNFTPKFARTYRVWSDTKRNGADQEYVFADLAVGAEKAQAPDAKPLVAGETSGLKFSLSFDGPVKAGEGVMGSVAVVDAKTGKPFTQLQPIMGAFGHVVAFSRDWGSIEHVHPLGDEPTKDTDRSGPVIGFHMEPQNAGVLKIFVQILANGRETIVPFTVNVEG
jgi:hypothetical protein